MKTRSFPFAVAAGLSLLLAASSAHAFGLHLTRIDIIRGINADTMNTSSISKTSETVVPGQKSALLDDALCTFGGLNKGSFAPLVK